MSKQDSYLFENVLLWVDLCVHICYGHFCEHAINLEAFESGICLCWI